MQRRAAAAYFVFFLVLSVAAYAYIGVAESQRPEVNIDGTAELKNESSFQVNGTTYTASEIGLSGGGGGHGGGGGSMAATLSWQNQTGANQTTELSEGGNVTLQGQQYFAHFPDHKTVQIISIDKYPQYKTTLSEQDYFHERTNGLWGISILSGIAAVMMLGMAYLPTRG